MSSITHVSYRVYKLNLLTELLVDVNFIRNFSTILQQLAEKLAIPISKNNKKSTAIPIRQIAFYDTIPYDLYRHGFILRQRHYDHMTVAGIKKKSELTLKFRHTDKAIAAATPIYACTAKSKVKFKKQIFNRQLNKLESLYSHSVTVVFSPSLVQQNIGKLMQVFPVLATLSVDLETKLYPVNQINIEESVINLCHMHFDKNVEAHAVMIIWRYLSHKDPLAVEFELRVKRVKSATFNKKTKELLKTYYQALQVTMYDWLSYGVTKTSLIYGI